MRRLSSSVSATSLAAGSPRGTSCASCRDRDDVLALSQDPGEGELSRRADLLTRKLLDLGGEALVVLERFALPAGTVAPEVAFVELVG
jgi:hypothetical protein